MPCWAGHTFHWTFTRQKLLNYPNFSRQIRRQYAEMISGRRLTPDGEALYVAVAAHLANAEKFMLPEGGRVLGDHEYRALDEVETLHLPYPTIALEYHRTGTATEGKMHTSKAVVLARQTEEHIFVQPVFWVEDHNQWYPLREAKLPRIGYLVRNQDRPVQFLLDTPDDVRSPEDYDDEVGALMDFLNALQCSNVKSISVGSASGARKIKSALPFDTYHVLSVAIGTSKSESTGEWLENKRSPREHLRRGHIRRYASGLKIWVNAAVINPGTIGHVFKDYVLSSAPS